MNQDIRIMFMIFDGLGFNGCSELKVNLLKRLTVHGSIGMGRGLQLQV